MPREYYRKQKEHFDSIIAKFEKNIGIIALFRLSFAILIIILLILSSLHYIGYFFPGVTSLLFLFLVRFHNNLKHKREFAKINLEITERELFALDNDCSSFPNGSRFIDTNHAYSYDLDLFGNRSIYQMLCRSTTKSGEILLAEKLLHMTLEKNDVLESQEIIRELSRMPEFLLHFRAIGSMQKEEDKDNGKLHQWLKGSNYFIGSTFLRFATPFIQLASVVCIISFIFKLGTYPLIGFIVTVNWLLLSVSWKKIKIASQQIGDAVRLVDKYHDLIRVSLSQKYETPWLQQMSRELTRSFDELTRFKKLIRLFDSRNNGLVGPIMNTLFLFDIYCLLKLESWREKNVLSVLASINLLIKFDLFVGNSVYSFNHPEFCYPVIVSNESGVRAKDLRHPLLPFETAIGNDVDLGANEQFYLLTGANMTGKSTFIRTIGISQVLCNLGLPLPAKEIALPIVELYTSMSITDSLIENFSYFKSELERIKFIVGQVKKSTICCLVLLDEPLRGTNSADKQQGTRLLIESLLKYKTIGILATHDIGLCDLETTKRLQVRNYHFDSVVNAQELSFDFKLKVGCSNSTNATIIMSQMKIFD